MAILVYNAISLDYLRSERVEQKIVYDPTDTDQIGTEIIITVDAILLANGSGLEGNLP